MTTNRRWLAAALGIWLAAALAVHPVPAQAAQSQQNADATLRIVNESEQEICYVYLSLTTASTWGDDWLGNDTILPGESYSFSLVSGEYDVKLVDCRGNELLVRWYLALSNSHELSYSGADPCLASNQEGYRLYVQARYAEALQRFEWALACFREVGDRAGEGNVLSNIGRVYYGQGRYGEALDYYQQALAIRREVGDRANEGTTLNNIGGVYHDQGRYGEALDYYQQALAIRREVGDRAGEGITLNNIGLVYRHQGWYGEALDYYQQALAIGREVGDRAGEGITLNNIGLVYDNQGRYGEALDYYQQALAIVREVGDRVAEGATLNNIGAVYDSQGRYGEALDYYQQALAIGREVGDRAGEGATLSNIGLVYGDQGRYGEALDYYQQALAIGREVGDRAGEGTTLNNIGLVYYHQGRYAKALDYYQQALAIVREVGDRAGEGTTLNNIGAVYRGQGRYGEALDYCQQALAIVREVGDRAGEGINLNDIGLVYGDQGRYGEALDYYEQAMEVFESLRTVAGSEAGRAGFIAQYADLYQRTVALYHQQGQDAQAFQTSERGRARVFLDSLATGHVELSDQQAATLLAREQETYAARQAAQDALAAARAFVPPDPPLVAGLEAQLAAAEQQHAAALAAIETRGDQLAALVPGRGAVPELADVQALLPDQTALLSYQDLSDQGTLAFILTRDSFTVVNLPQATPTNLRTAIDDLYQWLNRDNPHPLPLQKLHAWLVAPLAQHLHTPFVGLIPHQLLHYVPFAALTDGETYFGQQHILFTLPSASALPFIQANASDTPGTGALVFGNPETEEPGLLPLLRSAAEAQAVAEGLGAAVYTGREASEARLRRQVGGRGVVHLAAHGGYNVVAPLYSAIHLAPGDGQDGRLEAHEVYGLDLGQTDLVVLSACRSNVGELSAGDELVGLTRAFFYAGAPTVIASLWSVDDAATEKLMVAFYRQWREGMGKAEALQAAQAEVQKTHPGPFYWAAFVLSGDPGQVSPTAQPTEPSPTPSPTQPAPTPTGTPSAGKGDGLCGSTAMLPLALILLAFTQDRGSRKPGQPRHMR